MQALVTVVLLHSLVDHKKSLLSFEAKKRKVGKRFRLFLKACMTKRWRRKMQKGLLQ